MGMVIWTYGYDDMIIGYDDMVIGYDGLDHMVWRFGSYGMMVWIISLRMHGLKHCCSDDGLDHRYDGLDHRYDDTITGYDDMFVGYDDMILGYDGLVHTPSNSAALVDIRQLPVGEVGLRS